MGWFISREGIDSAGYRAEATPTNAGPSCATLSESVSVGRFIHAGPIRFGRGRRRDENVMISGALTLLTNAVIAYNTWKLNRCWNGARQPANPFRATRFWLISPPLHSGISTFRAFIGFHCNGT